MCVISLEDKKQLCELVKRVVKKALLEIQSKIDLNGYIPVHIDYPVSVSFTQGRWPSTSILSGKCVDYSGVLSIREEYSSICVYNLDGFNDCVDFVRSNEELVKRVCFSIKDGYKIDISLFIIIGNILERYIHCKKTTNFSEDAYSDVFWEVLNSYLEERLYFDLCIPILMIEFEDDFIKLSDNHHIIKMTENFIRSKFNVGSDTSFVEKTILDCATHMLVINGYSIENNDRESISGLEYSSCYPLDVINKFFASLRSVTKYPTGYAQIVCTPKNNWVDRLCRGDLLGLTGAKVQAYPEYFKDGYWTNPHKCISSILSDRVKDLFLLLIENESRALDLAIDRLNRSEFRMNEEDTILDAVIGLELLLTDDGNGELTYKVSSRMATLSTLYDAFPFTPIDVKKSISKIYDYRSSIAHGRKVKDKSRTIEFSDKSEIEAVKLAIDYLRYAIEIMAKHPEYLKPENIDKLMMSKLL